MKKILLIALTFSLALSQNLYSQITRTFTNNTAASAWLTPANWLGATNFAGNAPLAVVTGEGLATDVMTISAANGAANVGINMNTLTAGAGGVGLVFGGIDFNKTATALTIGNSSTTVNGIIQLNGATINAVPNTLVRVAGTVDLTIANANTGSTGQRMGFQLGNANGIIDVAASRTLTISSSISESAASSGLTKTGAGTLTLSGTNNTYSGNTTLSAGTISIAESSSVPAKLGNGTGTLILAGGTLFRSTQNTSEIHFNPISLTENSTMSGNTSTARSMIFSNSSITLTPGKSLTIRNTVVGGVFEMRLTAGGFNWTEPIILGVPAEGLGALGPRNDNTVLDQIYSGVISGPGKIVRNVPSSIPGGNAIISNGGNSYAGGTELRAGFLGLAADNPLGTGPVTFGWDPNPLGLYASGAARVLTNAFTADLATGPNPGLIQGATNLQIKGSQNLTLSGPIAIHTNVTFFTISNTALTTISGVISNKGPVGAGLFKQGLGTLVFSGDNTYSGLTTVGAGKLQLGASERIPDGSAVSISSGAVLDLTSFTETVGSLAGAGQLTNSSGTGALIAGGNGNSTTFSGIAGGVLSLTKAGGGTLALTGINTYSGNTTNGAGTISLNATSTMGNGSGTVVLAGGNILANNNRPSTPVANPILVAANASIFGDSASGSTTRILPFSGNLSGTAGTLTVRNTGIATTTFRVDLSGSGFSFGQPLVVGAPADTAGAFSELAFLNGAGTDQTFTGDISGSGTLRRTGSGGGGRTILTGNNSYSGGTVISLGTLVVNNIVGSGTGSGNVAVNGGTLAGAGTISGAVSVSGAVAPGNSIGTLTTGTETWNSGGTYVWEIDDAAGTAGISPGWDMLNITGNLDVQATAGSKFNIELHSLNGGSPGNLANFSPTDTDYAWRLVTVATTIDNFAANKFAVNTAYLSNSLAGGHFAVSAAAPDLFLSFSSNRPPVAVNDSFSRSIGSTIKFTIASLLANDSDADAGFVADGISFVNVSSSSTNGASVSNDLTRVYFNPTNLLSTAPDSFTYTIQDNFGHQATGTVLISVVNVGGLGQTIDTAGGGVTIGFSGIPGYQYDIERAEDVNFTVNVTTVVTTNAPANGQFSYTDGNPPQPTAFYRLKYNP